jgi:hypothetical protein
VQLVGAHEGFNLVRYGGRAYGLRQALGEVDVRAGEAALRERYGAEDVIVADTVEAVVARIEARRLERAVRDVAQRVEIIDALVRRGGSLFAKVLARVLRAFRRAT